MNELIRKPALEPEVVSEAIEGELIDNRFSVQPFLYNGRPTITYADKQIIESAFLARNQYIQVGEVNGQVTKFAMENKPLADAIVVFEMAPGFFERKNFEFQLIKEKPVVKEISE